MLTSKFLDWSNISKALIWRGKKLLLDLTLLQAVHIDMDAIWRSLD